MKCPNCSFENIDNSVFCQECGHKLINHSENKSQSHPEKHQNSIYKEIENEIGDVIFKPKKKNRFKRFIFLVLIAIVAFVGLIMIASYLVWLRGQYIEDSYQQEDSTTQAETEELTTFPVYDLNIENPQLEWVGQELYFTGTIKNSNSRPAKDIKVRLDLYWDKALEELFDTRFVTVIGAPSSGAFTFEVPVYAFPEKQFWWTHRIESASY